MAAALVAATLLPTPAQAAPTRYEAENAPAVCNGTIDTNWTGFSGTGFCNTPNAVGAAMTWTVSAASAGSATLGIRYANGTTTDRPADVVVNGATAVSAVSFPGTGAWTTWATKTLTVQVNSGSNTIKLSATTTSGDANIDFLDFEVAAPAFTDYQAENCTISQGVVESNHTGFTGTGFVNYDNATGSYVECAVSAASAGTATLTYRYFQRHHDQPSHVDCGPDHQLPLHRQLGHVGGRQRDRHAQRGDQRRPGDRHDRERRAQPRPRSRHRRHASTPAQPDGGGTL
jgi:hypothetical protein